MRERKMKKKAHYIESILILLSSIITFWLVPIKTQAASGEDIANLAKRIVEDKNNSYEWAQHGPTQFDCVGLVKYCYEQYGVTLPMGTSSYANGKWAQYGTKITNIDDLRAGDVVFYGENENSLSHAAIYWHDYLTFHALNEKYGLICLIIDTATYNRGYTSQPACTNKFAFGLRVYGISGSQPQPTEVENDALFSSVYADPVTTTNAKIGFTLKSQTTIQNCGFAIGQKSSLSDGKLVSESSNDFSATIAAGYGAAYGVDDNGNPNLSSKWGVTLSPGTKYYYKVWIKMGGVKYYSSLRSFTTTSIAVTGVSLNKSSVSLDGGGTYQLSATVSPSNATNKNVTWSSSNNGVAIVNASGLVTAVSNGTATITATAADGSGKKATCSVTVKTKALSGDTSGDGKVNLQDCVYLARCIGKWPGYTMPSGISGDYDRNGKVNLMDCVYLARYIGGWSGYTLN